MTIDPKSWLEEHQPFLGDTRAALIDKRLEQDKHEKHAAERAEARKKKWQGYTSWLGALLGLALTALALWDRLGP